MEDDGGPGVYVSTPKAPADAASIRARLRLSNDTKADTGVRYRIDLYDAAGQAVAAAEGLGSVASGGTSDATAELALSNPHLWNGIADPYLYKVVATLFDTEGRVRDRVELPLGIRSIEVTADKGLLLNGRSYRLRGVNYFHAQRPGRGTAVTDEEIPEDMRSIAELAATAVRLVTNQSTQRAHDDAGWEELRTRIDVARAC